MNGLIKIKFYIKYSEDAINDAAINGHVKVLEWFNKELFQFRFRFTRDVINSTAINGHIDVLNWIKINCGCVEFKYTQYFINASPEKYPSHVIEWFKNNIDAVNPIFINGNIGSASMLIAIVLIYYVFK